MKPTLVPRPWSGVCQDIIDAEFLWLKNLGDQVYCALYQSWISTQQDLPQGYDLYVVSFYHEAINLDWIRKQSSLLQSPIIVLSDGNWYDQLIPNVHFVRYYYWHNQIEKLLEWYPLISEPKNITKKFSSICYRVGLNRAIIISALIEKVPEDDIVISFGDWIAEDLEKYKNTGWREVDYYVEYFRKNFQGTKKSLDLPPEKLVNSHETYQQHPASDYYIPAYQTTAINFNNESFFCSLMKKYQGEKYIHPGPFITEKTLKCLVAGTAFISTGQFDTYKSLENLGLRFDYGFDLSWDSDPGNLSRLTSIIGLIEKLQQIKSKDLYDMTFESTKHNQDILINKIFYHNCQANNLRSKNDFLEKFGR